MGIATALTLLDRLLGVAEPNTIWHVYSAFSNRQRGPGLTVTAPRR